LLGAGVAYGIFHRNVLVVEAEQKRKHDEVVFREELIKEAKAEYQKRNNPVSTNSKFPESNKWLMCAVEINWKDRKSVEDAIQRFVAENK
jgi:hypothetical protein